MRAKVTYNGKEIVVEVQKIQKYHYCGDSTLWVDSTQFQMPEEKAEEYIQTAFETGKIDLTKEKCIHGYGAIN